MTLMETFDTWLEIKSAMEKVDTPELIQTITCMVIHYAAARSDMDSAELLGKLSPIILSTSAAMGRMEI